VDEPCYDSPEFPQWACGAVQDRRNFRARELLRGAGVGFAQSGRQCMGGHGDRIHHSGRYFFRVWIGGVAELIGKEW